MQKAMITGVAGLVGHGIARYLLSKEVQVFGTSRQRIETRHPRFVPLLHDLSSPEVPQVVWAAAEESDLLIHNAALIESAPDASQAGRYGFYDINFLGTIRLLEMLRRQGKKKRFVLISSTAVVNPAEGAAPEEAAYHPATPYYVSKIAAELACRQYAMEGVIELVCLRIRAPYGYRPRNKAVVALFLQKVRASEDLTLMGQGLRTQAFTFVEDIGAACEAAAATERCGTYHITGPESVTMQQLAETLLRLVPTSRSRITYSGQPDPGEGRRIMPQFAKAQRDLGFCPAHNIEQGLRKILEFDFDRDFMP